MPCQLSDEEARAMEMDGNDRKYGIATTDADIAATVACQACRELERTERWRTVPRLVKLWWAEHKRRDAERQRNEQAAARQKEADERATLKRLMKKYPEEKG